jgi:hypothetical protein
MKARLPRRAGGGTRDRDRLRFVLCFCTVLPPQEIDMRYDHLRYTYSPSPIHLPRWVRQLWSWF